MKSKFKKRIQLAIIIAILSLLPLGIHQTFAHIAQSEQADWMICEAKFIAEPIFQEPPVTPFFSPFSEWDVAMPLPDRPLTPVELAAWNAAYCEHGHISEIEREILRLTNIERANYSLPPLTLNCALSRAARFKSQEMLDLDYFAHQSPVYGHFSNIPLLFINNHQGLGENLFALLNWQPANITAEIFVQGWMDSPGHRENILRPELSELGVGVVIHPPVGAGNMNATATQIFGHAVSAPDHCICPMQAEQVVVTVMDVSGLAGSVVDVTIYLNENPGLIGLQLDIDFDRDILTATNVTQGAIMPLPTQPNFPIPANQPIGLTFEATGFDSIYGTGALATIQFEISAGASAGTTEIQLNGIMAIGGEPNFEMFPLFAPNGTVTIESRVGTGNNPVQVVAVNTSGLPSGFVDVPINLTANPGLIGLQLDVDFNREVLTAVSITPGTLMPIPTQPDFPIPADQPLGLTFEAAGFENIYGTGTLATIRFEISPNAVGTTTIQMDGIMAIGGEPNFVIFPISATNGTVNIETVTAPVHVFATNAISYTGGYVDVAVNLSENPGLIGLQVDVDFNRDILTAISITPGTLIPIPTQPTFPIPADQPLGLTFEAAGFENIYGTGNLATIRFRVTPGVTLGTTPIVLDGIMAIGGEPHFEMFDVSTANGSVNVLSMRDKLAYLLSKAQNLQNNTHVSVTPGIGIPQTEYWAYQDAHDDFIAAILVAVGVLADYDAQANQ